MEKKKLLGQTFTEDFIVDRMIQYYEGDWSKTRVLEPSFGDGQFLKKIFNKIIDAGKEKKFSDKKIAKIIEQNVLGYEIDNKLYELSIENLQSFLKERGFKQKIQFKKILKNDSIFSIKNNDTFDLIIGNPPYVRVQNFTKNIKRIQKSLELISGNTDLFLIFINFLIKKLKKLGEFIFIVPNSLGKSKAALKIRKYLFEKGSLKYFDYQAKNVFAYVSVYVCIFKFKYQCPKKEHFFYLENKEHKNYKINDYHFFEPSCKWKLKEQLGVKNGLATLADKIFIHRKRINIENEHLLVAHKGSRMKEKFYAIFPYKIQGTNVFRFKSEKEFKLNAPKTYKFLKKFEFQLKKRSLEKNTKWFEYGRSQAIKDVPKTKLLINTLIKPGQKKLKIKNVAKNEVVFSGLYTTSKKIYEINNEELIKYLQFKAKDMRGGYKKISSSMLKPKG